MIMIRTFDCGKERWQAKVSPGNGEKTLGPDGTPSEGLDFVVFQCLTDPAETRRFWALVRDETLETKGDFELVRLLREAQGQNRVCKE